MLEDKKNDSYCIWKWFPLPKQYPSAMNDGKKMRWIHHNFSLKDLTSYYHHFNIRNNQSIAGNLNRLVFEKDKIIRII